MKFEIKLNDDLKDLTITADAQAISNLKYAVIVAKTRTETELEMFEDNPAILESIKEDHRVFTALLHEIMKAYQI